MQPTVDAATRTAAAVAAVQIVVAVVVLAEVMGVVVKAELIVAGGAQPFGLDKLVEEDRDSSKVQHSNQIPVVAKVTWHSLAALHQHQHEISC
jgi:hypothetical protein